MKFDRETELYSIIDDISKMVHIDPTTVAVVLGLCAAQSTETKEGN